MRRDFLEAGASSRVTSLSVPPGMPGLPATGRALVVHGLEPPPGLATGQIVLEGQALHCGFVEVPAPAWDPVAMPRAVLLRKRGFSCNYRDRALALTIALSGQAGRYGAIGSDFVAEVLACGAAVTEFRPGDRVIGNAAFPDAREAGVRAGVPNNTASREYQVLPAAKLMRVPDAMPDSVAAGFTIGAQSASAMVRRLAPAPGVPVLVTAARANTSLFAIAALRARGIEVHGTTTSPHHHDRLRALGVAEVLEMGPGPANFAAHPVAAAVMARHGGYAAVLDPFADLHLAAAVEVLRTGGAYITCGWQAQHASLPASAPRRSGVGMAVVMQMMTRNLTLMGNCLGLEQDLAGALADHAAGRLPVTLDSIHNDTAAAAAFLHRTWLAPDRLGKVVFLYDRHDHDRHDHDRHDHDRHDHDRHDHDRHDHDRHG